VTRRCAPRCSVRPFRTIFVVFSTRIGCVLTFHSPMWEAVWRSAGRSHAGPRSRRCRRPGRRRPRPRRRP
jgi:hypothetical protein